MSNRAEPVRIAVLDDYQNVALSMADWSGLDKRAAITVFNDHMADPDAVVARLQSFDIVCVMRERTPMTRALIEAPAKAPSDRFDGPAERLDSIAQTFLLVNLSGDVLRDIRSPPDPGKRPCHRNYQAAAPVVPSVTSAMLIQSL